LFEHLVFIGFGLTGLEPIDLDCFHTVITIGNLRLCINRQDNSLLTFDEQSLVSVIQNDISIALRSPGGSCHRTIDIGPDAFLASAEIIEKPDDPYVRIAFEIGLYGTGTH
jgi:hypothetical protein